MGGHLAKRVLSGLWLVAGGAALFVLIVYAPNACGAYIDPPETRAAMDLRAIKSAIGIYKHRHDGGCPSKDDAVGDLVRVGILPELPRDPWGNEYQSTVTSDASAVSVSTLGADGVVGGDDDDADQHISVPCNSP